MFEKSSDFGYTEAVPAVYRKTLVFGEKTLLTEFRMQKGSSLPAHAHPYEQTGYLVRGRLRLTIGAESFDVCPGD
ncbi:MAG TPA: cupin domain-containing protein, partial [Polyangiaceae bacterium]|nr:cupin domain-containing protein [Polyangiaceae bacterium]